MSDSLRDFFDRVILFPRRLRFAACNRVRYRRAWHYAIDRLCAGEAQEMLIDCKYAAGWYSLLTLTVDDTWEQALEDFEDHPELRGLIAHGCARAGRKWETYGDELYEARRWAIDVAKQYALDEGITLIPRKVEPDGDGEAGA